MPDGRLLALVNEHEAGPVPPYLWRLNADGTPDPTFAGGSGAFAISLVPRRPGFLFAPITIAGPDAAGRTLLVIWEVNHPAYFISVARVLADGTIDREFGVNGKASVRVADDGGYPSGGVVIQADGGIVVAGTSEDFSSGERPAVLARDLSNEPAEIVAGKQEAREKLQALLDTARPESVLGKHAERFCILQRHDPMDAQHALALLGEVAISRLVGPE